MPYFLNRIFQENVFYFVIKATQLIIIKHSTEFYYGNMHMRCYGAQYINLCISLHLTETVDICNRSVSAAEGRTDGLAGV